MKLLKDIITWFLDLFRTKEQVSQRQIQEMEEIVEKMEASRTNKQKRDWWLKSKGYTVAFSKEQKDIQKEKKTLRKLRQKQLSSFQSQVKRFTELKFKKKIEIYPALRNKQGIPYFELRKTPGEQLKDVIAG